MHALMYVHVHAVAIPSLSLSVRGCLCLSPLPSLPPPPSLSLSLSLLSVMSMFCNVIMLVLLYVYVCVTRTGWKTRPRPKTVILSTKKSNQSNQIKSLQSLTPSAQLMAAGGVEWRKEATMQKRHKYHTSDIWQLAHQNTTAGNAAVNIERFEKTRVSVAQRETERTYLNVLWQSLAHVSLRDRGAADLPLNNLFIYVSIYLFIYSCTKFIVFTFVFCFGFLFLFLFFFGGWFLFGGRVGGGRGRGVCVQVS